MSFLSAELSASLKTIVTTMSADLEAGPISHERCASFATEVAAVAAKASVAAVEPTVPVVAEKKPTKKKATTVKPPAVVVEKVEENTLLVPVDAEAKSVASAVVAQDPYASHKFRIAKPDGSLCMGRKIDVKNPIPGTRKGDKGATNIIFPEKQCSKKPLPGQKLCKICTEKHDEFNAKPTTVPKDYYGRLDEPMFAKARVIGCEYFFEKYPTGLADDPSTAPMAATVAATVAATTAPGTVAATTAPATAAAAVETKVKKPRAKKEKTVVATTNTTVAASEEVAVKPEWVTFLYEGRVHIRNESDGRTYEADTSKEVREDMVKKDTYKGRWRDGALDVYAPENDDE
jgi:hypothetical protein